MDPLTVEGHTNKFDSDDFFPTLETNTAVEFVFDDSVNNILFDEGSLQEEPSQVSSEFHEDVEWSSTPTRKKNLRPLSNNDKENEEQIQLRLKTFKENEEEKTQEKIITSLEDKINWKKYNVKDLKGPANPVLVPHLVQHDMGDKPEIEENPSIVARPLDSVRANKTSQASRGQARRGSNRRRPAATIVKSLASSGLAEKYEVLADKKNIIADFTIKKLQRETLHAEEEHQLRMKCLELDAEIKKKQLEKLAR